MERKEFSLVPEWLKAGAGGGTGGILQLSHQSLHQGQSGSLLSPSRTSSQAETAGSFRLGEYGSLPLVDMSEGDFDYWSLRRSGGSIGGLNVTSNSDRDEFSHWKPSFSYGHGSFSHSNEGLDRDSDLRGTDHDWKHDKYRANRERGKNRASAFTAMTDQKKDIISTDFSALHLQRGGNVRRYDIELPLHGVDLMGASRRVMINGEKEPATVILGAPADGLGLPSTRAATPPALMSFTSSESLASRREAEVSHASSDLATSSQYIGKSFLMKETTQAIVNMAAPQIEEEPDSTRGLLSTKVVSPREKSLPKVSQSVEMGASIVPNGTQALSQNFTVAHQPLLVRHEYSKPKENKLSVRNSNQKVIAPMVPSKPDGMGSFGSSEAMHPAQISQASGANVLSNHRRNPKQLFYKTVPILSMPLNSGTDGGPTPQTREPSSGGEDKRSFVPARNRTEFFNNLRRKAAENGAGQSNFVRPDSVIQDKTEEVCKKGELEVSLKISNNYAHDDATQLQENRTTDSAARYGEKVALPVNGLIVDEIESVVTRSYGEISVEVPDAATCSEEEEEAFLRSLGWEDNAEEEEALTEEEINAFYQQHGNFLATSRSSMHKQTSKDFLTHSDTDSPSPGSISSSLGSSERDSDDKLKAQQ